MRHAVHDLHLTSLDVIHAGEHTFPLGDKLRGVATSRLLQDAAVEITQPVYLGISGSMVEFMDQRFGRETIRKLLAAVTIAEALKILNTSEAQLFEDWKARGGPGPAVRRAAPEPRPHRQLSCMEATHG
jgi:hypothetical protein